MTQPDRPNRRQPVKCLLVTGGFSSNRGDTAILETSRRLLSEHLPDWRVRPVPVFSGLLNTLKSFGAIAASDVVLLNVGHPIQDETSWVYTPAVFHKLMVARLLRRKTGILASGVSELHSALLKRFVRAILNRCCLVSVRDAESADRLRAWGVKGEVLVAADPALLLEPEESERAAAFLDRLPDGPLVGIAPRRWFHYRRALLPMRGHKVRPTDPVREAAYRTGLVEAARSAADEFDATVVFVSMNPGAADRPGQDDAHFCEELMRETDRADRVRLLPPEFRPGEIKWCLGRMQCLIGVRMHSTILALGAGTPAINVNYNEKGVSLFQAFGLERYCLPIETCDDRALPGRLRDLWASRDEVARIIARNLPDMQARARRPYEILAAQFMAQGGA